MRIALAADPVSRKNGGISAVVYELCHRYAAAGHEVVLFGMEDEYSQIDCEAAGVRFLTVPARRCCGINYAPALKAAMRKFAPDVVHIHGIWNYAEIAGASLGVPYAVSPHGMFDKWALRNSAAKKLLFNWLCGHRILRNAAAVCALCGAEAESIRTFRPDISPVVIPNGVSVPAEDSPLPTADGKKELLYLGRLHPKKGAHDLIRAFSRVAPSDWRLVIAGWDQHGFEQRLRDLAAGASNIVFAGALFGDEKDAALRRCSAFILPSYSEGLPMSVLEAWAYRKPALITDQCNLPESFSCDAAFHITAGESGVELGLREFFSLTEAQQRGIGDRARALVEQDFSWDDVAKRYLNLYDSLANGRNALGK